MTSFQRVKAILSGLLMIVCCGVLVGWPALGFPLIGLIVCVSLLAEGVHSLIYYITMARHMVGGQLQFYKGLFMLDIGLFFLTMNDPPTATIMLYLLIGNVIAGVIDVLKARESRRLGSNWKISLATGIINVVSGIACVFCLGSPAILVYIYAAGLFYTACLRILSAFRKTAIIYIP